MILYCIRHGESTYNAEGRVQGQSDVPLSALGQRQSEAVAAALAGNPVEAVYASPLRRAFETARPVAEALGLKIHTDDRLKEIDVGIFQDRLRRELRDVYPDELARWSSGDLDYRIPGGESRRDLIDRGSEVIRSICASSHDRVAVVAHGRLLVLTLKALAGLSLDSPPDSLENGSISTLVHCGDGKFELAEIDRVEHLRGVGLAGPGDL